MANIYFICHICFICLCLRFSSARFRGKKDSGWDFLEGNRSGSYTSDTLDTDLAEKRTLGWDLLEGNRLGSYSSDTLDTDFAGKRLYD